jgi:predicted naringenin-chalcone synthase
VCFFVEVISCVQIDVMHRRFRISFYNLHVTLTDMRILHLYSALPENQYTTEEMIDNFSCELPEGVRQNVFNLGVAKRSFINPVAAEAGSENLLDEAALVNLCVRACENVVQETGVPRRGIGYFITAYDVNPILSPGLSQLLVRKIGFDPYVKHVNAQGTASTAFPKALQLAEDHLAGHPEDYVLICVSGVSSYWFQNQVRGMEDVLEVSQINRIEDKFRRQAELRKWIAVMECFLFGDAAVAAVVANHGSGLSVAKTVEVTNVDQRDYLAGYSRLSSLPGPFKFGLHSHLDKEIPNLGVKYAGLALWRLLGEETGKITKISKRWAVHTGSQKILDALAEHHGVDPEKLRESHEVLKEHGNLSGASLPFILERIVRGGCLSKGDIVLMIGYGWGFSAAASLLES